MTQLTTIELFAGIAGFSTPYTRPLAFVEKEATCRAVIRRHYPNALILDDVRTAGAHNLPWANIIKFGFPCQDLSVAGNRAGLSGARSGLFYEATRIVNELQPDFALWENVPGLLSSDNGRDFARVLLELDRIGYSGCWTMLDAQFFGVAQRRQRVFGLFARRDIGAERCAEILSLTARLPWNITQGGAKRARVAASIAASAGHHGHSSPRGDGGDNLVTTAPFTFDWMAGSSGDTSFRGKSRAWIVDKPGRSRALTANRTLAVCGALSAAHGGADDNDGQANHIVAVRTAQTSSNGWGIDEGGPSYTLDDTGACAVFVPSVGETLGTESYSPTKSSSGQMIDFSIAPGFGVRRLTPRECERLQGFPDDWTAWGIDESGVRVEMSDSVRYRMLGNAVCRNVSAWIDKRITEYI